MSQPLVFYDILSPKGERKAVSVNTLKSRFVLNYKKVPYTTVWAEYADAQKASKEIGTESTGKRVNGEPKYTLPAIRDPSTGEAIADSVKIIQYLEAKYPEKPLIPSGEFEKQVGFEGQFFMIVGFNLFGIVAYYAYNQMTPYNRGAFERVVREADGGPPLAERPAPTSENFQRMQQGLTQLSERYEDKKYIFGDNITYADFIIASFLVMLAVSLPEEKKNEVFAWNGGRWKALLDEFENAGYMATDHGELYVPKD